MKSAAKSKFAVNERVLCYEPDLTKARVVYEAKVLKVEIPIPRLHPKEFHYLVHFQGWSATWDRYVTEEFLLKTTNKNKELQKKLFAEAHAADLEKRKRKRKSENLSVSVTEETSSPVAKKACVQPSPKSVTTESSTATSIGND